MAVEATQKLANEKAALINTVKKLNREVAKLEGFKRNLMNSLRDDDDVRQWRCAFSLLQSSPSQTLPCPSSHSEPAPWSSHRQRQSNFLMARDRTLLLSFIPPPCLTCSVAMDFARARRKSEAAGT